MNVSIVSMGRSHLINLARLLDRKDDVTVTFYTMMPVSRCRKFGYEGQVVSFLFTIGVIFVLLERLPLNPYIKSALRFKIRRWFDALCAWFLRRTDVLIGLNGCAVKASIKARRKYGAVTICDQGSSHILTQNEVHDSYSDVAISQESTDYMLAHYNTADYFMAPSDYVRETDVDKGIDSERILLNPYGVDISRFGVTANPAAAGECYDVIMVGSWWKHKGCDLLAKACVEILGIRLLHVGAVIDCELPDSPLFSHIDFVPEFELPKYYGMAKISVLSSLDEGFGLVLLQAAACGCPIVYSKYTGGRNVNHLLGESEWCFEIEEPLTPETIAASIACALKKYDELPVGKRSQYGKNIENITWEAYADRYFNILKSIVKS